MNSEIYELLLEELREKTKKECTGEYGHILFINKITRIIGDLNVSSINCDIVCDVEFDAEILKPKVGDEYDGEVCVILPKVGILIEVKKCLKILVKADSLENYTYDSARNVYSHNKNRGEFITVGNIIRVRLRGVKYADHKFCCFGDFVE